MIFGVDGTGAFWNSTYKKEMRNSFVSELCGAKESASDASYLRSGDKHYWRGPDGPDTFLSGPNPRTVAEVIRKAVVPNAPPPQVVGGLGMGPPVIVYPTSATMLTNLKGKVFLTGYSRGAATMLDVAVLLKGYGIPVEAMFLFDSVTKTPWLKADVLPSNVKNCYHAKRNPTTFSRVSFENSDFKPQAGVNLVSEDKFLTTHGGMGNTPWGAGGLVKAGPFGVKELYRVMGQARSVPTSRQVAEAMVKDEPFKYGDKIYEGFPDSRFTTVTVAQETRGAAEVREWMWGHLRAHKVV